MGRKQTAKRAQKAAAKSEEESRVPGPVVKAVHHGDIAPVITWLDQGGSVDALIASPFDAEESFTMLMFASILDHVPIVDLLLERGASVNFQASDGGTALVNAAGNGHLTIVKKLLGAGADTSLRDRDGHTVLEHGEALGFPDCIAAILEHRMSFADAERQPAGAAAAETSAEGSTSNALPPRQLHETCEFFEVFVAALARGYAFACLTAEQQAVATSKIRSMRPDFEAELEALKERHGVGTAITGMDIEEMLPRVMMRNKQASDELGRLLREGSGAEMPPRPLSVETTDPVPSSTSPARLPHCRSRRSTLGQFERLSPY